MPYLGKQDDLICFVKETVEELNALPCVKFTSIEYTEEEYVMLGGLYVPKSSIEHEVRNEA